MNYTIYRIINNLNGKHYIGKHQTQDLNDGYMGSGKILKHAIKKYGIQNFTKEILHIFETEEEMNAKEKELVTLDEMSYNLCPGGQGGFGYINTQGMNNNNHEHVAKVLSEKFKGISKPFLSERNKKLHALGVLKPPPNWTGKTHTKEAREKIGKGNKGKIPWNKGRPRTDEEKKRISEQTKKAIQAKKTL